ncbi:MAG TPA: hypothetical protein VER03_11955 [Bryobacteraceae bacterium]|nr:hypothetical protein [Bryobacteraceae bacterium]
MTAEVSCDAILDDAMDALLSMAPDRIERAELALQHWRESGIVGDAGRLQRLKLLRVAAVGAAHLWRGSVPQPGYSPAGPADPEASVSRLSITG